ncbi:MAG: polymer-forming cytoskeletal protein, partial [Gemmatimonadales bacterium]
MAWVAGILLAAAGARPAAAQDTLLVIRPNAVDDTTDQATLAPEVVQQLLRFYNDSATTRLASSFTLPAGSVLEGRVAVYRGTLRIYGRIRGPVAVINGDLIVGPGGVLEGSALVVGGRLYLRAGGTQIGETTTYEPVAPVYRLPNGLLDLRERRKPLGELAAARTSFQTGSIR